MANTNSPFGFQPYGTVSGAAPNWRLSSRLISSTNTTAIYTGDAVVPVISTVNGYITQATAGTTALAGIFAGCEYTSVSQGNRVRSRFYPGSDANGDVTAYVIDNPDAVFLVQAGTAAMGLTCLNENAQLTTGTGSSTTGQSGMFLNSTTATTSTYPFTVVGFVQDPNPGQNGTDITTAYNWVLVTFNNEIFRAGLTSVS
jgi:hypothetical protein